MVSHMTRKWLSNCFSHTNLHPRNCLYVYAHTKMKWWSTFSQKKKRKDLNDLYTYTHTYIRITKQKKGNENIPVLTFESRVFFFRSCTSILYMTDILNLPRLPSRDGSRRRKYYVSFLSGLGAVCELHYALLAETFLCWWRCVM